MLDDGFDILRKASVAESRRDTGRFGDELLRVVFKVDANRIDLEQDVDDLVVQGAILGLESRARGTTVFVFAHGWQSGVRVVIRALDSVG